MKRTEANIRLLVETAVHSGANEDNTVFNPATINGLVSHYYVSGEFEPKTDEESELWALVEEALEDQYERYQPSERLAWEDNAPRIPVKIGDREYQTYIDQHGVQRFVENAVMTRLMESMTDPHAALSLNTLVIEYQRGAYSADDWLDFMTSFGYSVSGLCSLNEFCYLPVENPLWDEETD